MIRVSVVSPSTDRRSYRLRYFDPDGRQHWRSSHTADRREAERAAAKWEEELAAGVAPGRSTIAWSAFRTRFETDYLPGLARKTQQAYGTVMNHVERILRPVKLRSVTTTALTEFAAALRSEDMSETSIKSYLGHVQGALSWAKRHGLVASVPSLPHVHRAKRQGQHTMKGRPITEAEYKAMLDATPIVVGNAAAPSWQFWIAGLWTSGLRLAESLELYWDRPDKMRIDFTGARPMLVVRAELEKGYRDRLLPIAPEFAAHLNTVPMHERHGKVFLLRRVESPRGGQPRALPGESSHEWAGRICARIGKKAGIVVDVSAVGRVKYASAHDLRRAFGTRWASRVMPAVLQQLMRHSDMKTTMRYYVSLTADDTAGIVWDAAARSGGEVAKCSVSCSDSAQTGSTGKSSKVAKRSRKTT